jgi:hypothetical protein
MNKNFTQLAAKLVKIMETLGSIAKKGYNKHQNYYYMREVDVMEALKEELIKNKIVMLTSSKLVDIQKKEGKDKTDFITTVETQHTFVDSETGEVLSINSVGSGYDSSDKGAAKAITSAIKYAIMKTFMISDEGLDIENDGVTAQPPAVKTPPKAATIKSNIKVAAVSAAASVQVATEAPPPEKIEEVKADKIPAKQINFAKRPITAKLELQNNKSEPNF